MGAFRVLVVGGATEVSAEQPNIRSALLALTGLRIEGGIASVNRTIVRILRGRVQRGDLDRLDVSLLFDAGGSAPEVEDRSEERLARGSRLRFVGNCWRLFRHYRQDLVFFDHVGPARLVLAPLPAFPPPRYAVFVHGGEMLLAARGTRARVLRGAWRIVVNSQHTARWVEQAIPDVASRIRVTPLCIDPDRVKRWKELQASRTTRPPEREPAALIVGRMTAEERGKGHDQLIAAWPRVRERLPEAELWIVGAGDDRRHLERCASASGLGEAVRFLGRVSDEQLHELYQRASLFAMPSRQEGFGLVYAEALWHGLPCLGSTADAASCVVDHERSGLLVPYGDVDAIAASVIRLLSRPEQVRQMGEAGRRAVEERFTYAAFERHLLAALEIGAASGAGGEALPSAESR